VAIAYRHIAERGFEGLRVRDVADEAGLNSATLHYYFPTKEALIQAVVEHILTLFSEPRVTADAPSDARTELRREFDDSRRRFAADPDLAVVLVELAARGARDPVIGGLLERLFRPWRAHLTGILRQGVSEGVFRADLDPDAVAAALIAQFKGIGMEMLTDSDAARLDQLTTDITDQVEHWLMPASGTP
jgi:AcrR family transcriptional regulator